MIFKSLLSFWGFSRSEGSLILRVVFLTFCSTKVFNFDAVSSLSFSFLLLFVFLMSLCKKLLPKPKSWRFTPLFSFKSFLDLAVRWMGFPDSSIGKESACNTGDPGSIPRSERSPGEGKGYPPVFWPRELHGLYSPWGHKELHVNFTFTFRLIIDFVFTFVYNVRYGANFLF